MNAIATKCVQALALLALALPAYHLRADDPASPLAAARALLLEGKYAEAEEAFAALPAESATTAAIGIARCQESGGDRDKALKTLQAAAKQHADIPAFHAEIARLLLERGDREAASQAAAAALKLDAEQPLARWVQAELLCSAGKLDEANAAYERLVKQYSDGDISDPEALHWIGLAAGQFARWNRLSDQFKFLVNEFYPDLLAKDEKFWPAHFEIGRLFAEKYNRPAAGKAFKAALVINPNSAPLHAALGRLSLEEYELPAAQASVARALEINPQCLAALHLKADIHFANFEPRDAAGVLGDALKLNPLDEATLGRLAAAHWAVDGQASSGPDSPFGKIVASVDARNPRAGVFYEALGDALDRLRRWPAAAKYYEQAATRMPQLGSSAGRWGMVLMRLGEEDQAKKILAESFEADPFNVRVNNTLQVLDVLAGYATHETPHFRIKYDPAKDKLLAEYMGRWLEEVYPQLVKQMGFEPPEKSLFEVFSKAKNTDGHGWFSARMVGLPRIHPIGACAGKIVALQSPSEGQQRFNWARVLKHEFVHVINLQQTDFNIPHWFTEGLAVLNEGYPRPQAWDDLLVAQSARGKLFNLETINFGFIRPHSSDEWTLAYCQALLYAQFMLAKYGDDAIAKMLAAYADNLTTPAALQRAFDVDQATFERGYTEYIQKLIAALPPRAREQEKTLPELQKALDAHPDDPALLAEMAQVQLNRKSYPEARRLADRALAKQPKQALAHYVRARLHLLVGENKEALTRLESALDRGQPQPNVLALLAGLRLKAEDYPQAAELYELGAKHDPSNSRWLKSLSAVYLKSGDNAKLAPVLEKLAAADPDDLTVRKKLAQMALADRKFAEVDRLTLAALHIQVMDYQLHAWRGEALAGLNKPADAAVEFAAAVELEPDEPKLRLELARAYHKSGDRDKATAAVNELLKRDPDFPGAAELLESLK